MTKIQAFLCCLLITFTSCKEKYLSDTDTDYKEIEKIQLQFLQTASLEVKPVTHEIVKKELEKSILFSKSIKSNLSSESADKAAELIKNINSTYFNGPLTTRYQNPLEYYVTYSRIVANIQKIANAEFPNATYTPKFGTYKSNMLNAERRGGENSYLLLMDSRFILFCQDMAEITFHYKQIDDLFDAQSLQSNIKAFYQYENAIDTSVNLRFQFLKMLLNYFNPKAIPPTKLKLSELQIKYSTYLATSMQWFILGHEYSHAIKKHQISFENSSELLNDTLTLKSWCNEIEADSLSQKILDYEIDSFDFEEYHEEYNFRRLGGLFYFTFLNIFEQTNSIINFHRVPVNLTQDEIKKMNLLFKRSLSFGDKLKVFSTLSPDIKKFDHPPTEYRLILIKKLCSSSFEEFKNYNENAPYYWHEYMSYQSGIEIAAMEDYIFEKVTPQLLNLSYKK